MKSLDEFLNEVFEQIKNETEWFIEDAMHKYCSEGMAYGWVSMELLEDFFNDEEDITNKEWWREFCNFRESHSDFEKSAYDWLLKTCKEYGEIDGVFVTDVMNMSNEDEIYMDENYPDWMEI